MLYIIVYFGYLRHVQSWVVIKTYVRCRWKRGHVHTCWFLSGYRKP